MQIDIESIVLMHTVTPKMIANDTTNILEFYQLTYAIIEKDQNSGALNISGNTCIEIGRFAVDQKDLFARSTIDSIWQFFTATPRNDSVAHRQL